MCTALRERRSVIGLPLDGHRAVEREWERRIHARTRERKLSQLI